MQSTTRRMTRVTSCALVVASAVALALAAGCSSGSETGPSPSQQHQPSPATPVTTTDSDWKPVADALGRSGKLGDKNTAYRVALPRNDLQVTSYGVAIKPGLSLGGYAAFTRYADNQTMLMGDLVVTEAELPKVTDALQAHGIAQTALHKHLLEQSPPIWWTHIHAMGDPVDLARGLKTVLAATAIPPASPPPASQAPIALDVAGIDHTLGRKGTVDGGIDKYTIARKETITD